MLFRRMVTVVDTVGDKDTSICRMVLLLRQPQYHRGSVSASPPVHPCREASVLKNVLAFRVLVCLSVIIAVVAAVAAGPKRAGSQQRAGHVLADYSTRLTDLIEQIHVVQSDTKELSKIGADFSATYSLKNMSMLYKQPDKLRLEGKSPTRGTALMILSGAVRFVDIPRFKIHITENLEKSPSRRQSLLELEGVLSPDTLKYLAGTYVKTESWDGIIADQFELHYIGAQSGQHFNVWLDAKTHITVKRQWFDAENHLKATFLYDQPKEVTPGIWLPTRIQVQNADGVTAATISMDEMQVNTGLSSDLFTIPS